MSKSLSVIAACVCAAALMATGSAAARPEPPRDRAPGRINRATTGPPEAARSRAIGRITGVAKARPSGTWEQSPPYDALYRAFRNGALSTAQYALQRALTLRHLDGVRARFGRDVVRPTGHDATMILRDLVLHSDELSGDDADRAAALLARPAPPVIACSTHFCIHWHSTGPHAPDPTDADASGFPDYVETVAGTFEQVWDAEVVQMGYRPPLPDADGPDTRLDVYLEDIGAQSLYGYCAPEPTATQTDFDAPGYCGVDNDFSPTQFPSGVNGVQALQVTAAHEFFHAVQFAFDFGEDRWFMEGTAAWMEDEVYDDVNDNLRYLATSALTNPGVPVDYRDEGFQYGAWLYFRYLSETYGRDLIREAWTRADGNAGAPDDYSVQALENALGARGLAFDGLFADFAGYNYVADAYYEEGSDYVAGFGYPPELRMRVTRAHPVKKVKGRLEHLSTGYAAFRPGKGVSPSAKLKIKFDLPASAAGAEATAIVLRRDGTFAYIPVSLSGAGAGTIRVKFGKGKIFQVGVALSNASTRYDECYSQQTPFACDGGVPRDDGRLFKATATLIQ